MKTNPSLIYSKLCLLPLLSILLLACANPKKEKDTVLYQEIFPVYGPYRVIALPINKGVKVLNPVFITSGPDGKIFASNQTGEIYSLVDSDGDGLEDEASLYFDVSDLGLRSPSSIIFKGDTAFVGTSQLILGLLDRNKDGKADSSWVVFDQIPFSHHPYEWTTGLCFGEDGKLYFNLTTDSWNDGASPDPRGLRGSILRVTTDGKNFEQLATGIRSVPSMAFHSSGNLFFVDNEGGGNPSEELNILQAGAFYGHNPRKYNNPKQSTGPAFSLKTELAPSGIVFNSSSNDFGGTSGDLFVAFYGPGERWNRGGVGRVRITHLEDGDLQFEEFPVVDIPKLSSLTFSEKGELYLAQHGVSDYWYNPTQQKSGGFYKLVLDPAISYLTEKPHVNQTEDFKSDNLLLGKQLYAELACLACHSTNGEMELLGPNLKDIGIKLTRAEILDEISYPSNIIKPSMVGVKVFKKDGQILLGRPVSIDADTIALMLIGNYVVSIPRLEIQKTENLEKSLMYEGLLTGLKDEEIQALLDYLIHLSND
ncbi:DUF7133 domain-containing protein [Cecembia rubra]|uniref:Putative heme-binding domain-containing protein n=1 Tax=Cecembia rubra TaxID=1485585 RepID=A0A2P8ED01_9BACT|nr:PQQ-dependent sugar dehydrogenase [Cecembia rubra]PSL07338.1 putative heme-binding domain-containing protein [Cecembia rubra]